MPALRSSSVRTSLLIVAFSLFLSTSAARAQLGPAPDPPGNPTTATKAVLGKSLFWDEQLSSDNTVACGTCHRSATGGGDPRVAPAPGFDGLFGTPDDTNGSPGVIRSDSGNDFLPDAAFGLVPQVTSRFTPSMIAAGHFGELFWDGRASGRFVDPDSGAIRIPFGGALENQAIGPPLSDVEMAHESRDWTQITDKLTVVTPLKLASALPSDLAAALAVNPTYPDLFQAAFGTSDITAERIAFALAAYQRTLNPAQTPWDRFVAGDGSALTPNQQAGLALFTGPAGCARCHSTPLFSDDRFHNLGLRPSFEDRGRQVVTGDPADRGKFKTASLRNVGLRERFMHNGQLATLDAVLNFYNRGGDFADNQDPLIVPLGLSPFERGRIVDFLTNGLTDPRVASAAAPFDRPLLSIETGLGAAGPFGAPHAGSGGFAPRWLSETPLNIGNIDFKVGVADALGGAAALLGIAGAPGPIGQNVGGVPVFLSLVPSPVFIPVTLGGSGSGAGFGTVQARIPNLPGLVGRVYFAQWFIQDPVALGGFAATSGIRYVLF